MTSTSNTKVEKIVLDLFYKAADTVPAYKDFLNKNSIDPKKVKTIEDFKTVPFVDKDNYLKKYPLPDLCIDGDLFENQMISASSGSSGEPFFWPRGNHQDKEGAWLHEQIYRDIFDAKNKKTLVVG